MANSNRRTKRGLAKANIATRERVAGEGGKVRAIRRLLDQIEKAGCG